MFEHIIFDYDGVIVDSFEFHLNHYNQFFDTNLTPNELRDAHNGNFYENKTTKLAIENIRGYVDKVAPDQKTLALREGVKETLQSLIERGKICHLVTSSWERQCFPNLQFHQIDRYFTQMHFADGGFSKHEKMEQIMKTESISPNQCLFIADTLGDILESKQANIQVAALTCGFHQREKIEEGSPDYIFDSWDELDSFFKTTP